MKRKWIVNPQCGAGMKKKEMAALKAYFRPDSEEDFIFPKDRQDTIAQTRRLLEEGAEQIIVVGGDGTVNAVANGFLQAENKNENACLAIAKKGTGSDYFKSVMGGRREKDWREVVTEHRIQWVDAGAISFSPSQYQLQYFVNMASVGIVTDVVVRKERYPRWLPNFVKYNLPALVSLFCYRAEPVKITLDGTEVFDTKLIALCISKGQYAGRGMKFGANAILDDGLFDVTIMTEMPLLKMLARFQDLYGGIQPDNVHIFKRKCSQIMVQSALPLPVEFDGEIYGTTDIEITLSKKILPLCVPRG